MEKLNKLLKDVPLDMDGPQTLLLYREATPEQREEFKVKRRHKKRLDDMKQDINRFRNLPKLEKREDVPVLPRVGEKLWKHFFVPALIEAGAIPLMELEDGAVYEGDHRVGKVARWNAKNEEFIYPHWEWTQKTTDKCNHFEQDDKFALFVPLKKVAGKEVDLLTYLD
jgi:hypothetical protein